MLQKRFIDTYARVQEDNRFPKRDITIRKMIVMSHLFCAFSPRRELNQIENLMRVDWKYVPTSECEGAFMCIVTHSPLLQIHHNINLKIGGLLR
jgi:hypothetical protein